MNTTRLMLEGWSWNPATVLACGAGAWLYVRCAGDGVRWAYLGAAVGVVLVTLLSPLNTLADGVLFSAHMTQHILLLLIVPALLLFGLPRMFGDRIAPRKGVALLGWAAGVGSMWFWHVPAMCDAAATSPGVHAFQTISLLALGTFFWWPILAPSERQRLNPGLGVAYLFTACLACTALGIILTLTPVEVCPVFRAPLATSTWVFVRERVTAERDRQIGGLLMWVPMCLIYVAAIMFELGRWFGAPARTPRLHS